MSRPLDLSDLHALRNQPRRLLVVLAHPDDEAYGCAGALARAGACPKTAVVLLCLTDGEASSAFREAGQTPVQTASIRRERMETVQGLVNADALLMPGLPDGELADSVLQRLVDPIRDVLTVLDPTVVIGHDPRGVNGHPDHIATHWATRMALEARAARRFAMICYTQEVADLAQPRLLFATKTAQMDCRIDLDAEEVRIKEACLRAHDAIITLTPGAPDTADGRIVRPPTEHYEFWGEDHEPMLDDLFAGLPASS